MGSNRSEGSLHVVPAKPAKGQPSLAVPRVPSHARPLGRGIPWPARKGAVLSHRHSSLVPHLCRAPIVRNEPDGIGPQCQKVRSDEEHHPEIWTNPVRLIVGQVDRSRGLCNLYVSFDMATLPNQMTSEPTLPLCDSRP
jgi:hypothetical protein